jgi:hypothetical protein
VLAAPVEFPVLFVPGEPRLSATNSQKRTVAVLQPGYLPWLGFFDQIRRADVFVYYDDVQYDKHGWRNRNRVKSVSGEPHWLTVPVRHARLDWPSLQDVEIDARQPWVRKHVGTLRQFYAKAPFASTYLPALEEVLGRGWQRLVDLDFALVEQLCRWLGLRAPEHRSSALGIQGDRTERLVAICRYFSAQRYLSGEAARGYLATGLFAEHDIAVEWQDYHHPVYPQIHGAFVPYLSVVDLLLNCGDQSAAILARNERDPDA